MGSVTFLLLHSEPLKSVQTEFQVLFKSLLILHAESIKLPANTFKIPFCFITEKSNSGVDILKERSEWKCQNGSSVDPNQDWTVAH